MTPLTSSRFWQRRVYEVAFILSLTIVILWAVPRFTTVSSTGVFNISLPVAVGAVVVAAASLILYFVKKSGSMPSLVVFTLFSTTIGLLIWETNGLNSPFIGLWALLAFCSGIFGSWGVALVFVASTAYVVMQYAVGSVSIDQLVFATIVSIVPAIISLVVWRHQDAVDESSKHVEHLTSQLSEVANRSEIVINAIGDGVIAIDSLGVIQLINPAAQQILGWGKQDALALNYKSVLQMLDANNHEPDPSQDPVDQVLNTNQLARTSAMTMMTRSGKKITASLVVSPIGDAASGVIAVFRDVTKEKAEEHEQAEFISTASHEMRTPVASIEGYLGLALNPNTAQIDDKARDFILKAHEAAQHLGRLFQDLLDVSKSEDGRMANVPKVINLPQFVETIIEGLRSKATEKGLALTYAVTGVHAQRTLVPAYYVNQDNDHIREIVNNLIENAIKYTPSGEVVVDVQGSDERVVVSVKDSGLGIPPEDVPHLFQKFYRVDNADRQAIGGTGLGLYLSRRLAEAMQGRIWVESTHGKGSTFYLELPRISTEEAQRLSEQQTTTQTTITPASAASFPEAVAATAAPEKPVVQPQAPQQTSTPSQTTQPAQAPQPVQSAPVIPATSVPRGESLTREQIAERVRQLESLARQTKAERQAAPPANRQS